MKLTINTDGGSRGNPGLAAYGFIIRNEEGVILHEESSVIGITTNNIAEYEAVLKSLEYLRKYFRDKYPLFVNIITDSQLIAQQLSGNYKVKNTELKKCFDKIKLLELEIGSISYKNVPREQNFLADKLVNIAFDNFKK